MQYYIKEKLHPDSQFSSFFYNQDGTIMIVVIRIHCFFKSTYNRKKSTTGTINSRKLVLNIFVCGKCFDVVWLKSWKKNTEMVDSVSALHWWNSYWIGNLLFDPCVWHPGHGCSKNGELYPVDRSLSTGKNVLVGFHYIKIISNHISSYEHTCTTESSTVGTGRFKNGTDKCITRQVFFFSRETWVQYLGHLSCKW